ncbi:hypothetical protein GW17_00060251, partial [Ensete ventricosum]
MRPRKASAVTMNGAGLDAGEGNPGSVIILQKRLGVGTAPVTSSVGRGWCKSLYSGCCRSSVPGNPVALVAYPVVVRFHHARRSRGRRTRRRRLSVERGDMGCCHSRLERKEVVSRCKARRRYMKQLVQGRRAFAAAHSVYLRSLRATGAALLQFANAETH